MDKLDRKRYFVAQTLNDLLAKRPIAQISVVDLCEEAGISRSTFYEWRAKGRAPRCIKLPNGQIRIRRAEFERWLDSLEEVA